MLKRAWVHESSKIHRAYWSANGNVLITAGERTISVLAGDDLTQVRRIGNFASASLDIDASPNGELIASGCKDQTVRLWEFTSGKEVAILEGHRNPVLCARFSPSGDLLVSLSSDQMRVWRCRDWECVSALSRNKANEIGGVAFHPLLPILAVKDEHPTCIDCFRFDHALLAGVEVRPESRRYVNAKVMLLGDTGVGKSGLGLVLSGHSYQPTDSTHGRQVWTFDTQEVTNRDSGTQTREVLLWDLAGQPGYRMVHQLHLNEVAVALVVFDSRSETDPFSGVKHWVRALSQARRLEGDAAVPLHVYLVAGRADRGGVAVSMDRVRTMIDGLGLDGFFETSAKEGWQITNLAETIKSDIDWDALPMVSSSALFESIKQYLLDEKQQGRVLSISDDLFRGFLRTRKDKASDASVSGDESGQEDMRASFEVCIGRVESRDLIRRLHFGSLVLLQPELLDAYASAMVQAAKDEPDGLGFIRENDALDGRFRLGAEERISDRSQEKLLLIATVEELLRHEIALKETTDQGVDLVFPSQFTRERPGAPDIPGRQVTFTFEGPLQSIYASLAVRLAHSSLFCRQSMWQNAASYTSTARGTCGIYLRELEEGRGELALFYDDLAGDTVRSQFETYVAGHLELRALPGTVTRRRIRSCSECNYTLPDDLVKRRLARSMATIRCPDCDGSIITLLDTGSPVPAEAAVIKMNRSADERRDRGVAATRLKGKIETSDYDVFLCHNSKDKPEVEAIGMRLKEHGILPWLDIWEIRPGTRWQKEIDRRIKSAKSAAVFIGARGSGPWQELEVETLLKEFLKRGRPVIPVILETRSGNPRLPSFLSSWHIVDMRKPNPDPFDQLIWGITGEKYVQP